MKLSPEKLRHLCKKRGLTLSGVLRKARVSRSAFYSLPLKEDTVFPRSVRVVADLLGVSPSAFLEEESEAIRKARLLARNVAKVAAKYPGIDLDNVRHTFLLLEEYPVVRLRRALTRARKCNILKT